MSGVLPPYLGTTPTISSAMSPYAATLTEIAEKLCGTDARKKILRGLITFRQELNAIGLNDGFQWVSGSFLEDIEVIEKRDPRDVDVVTFLRRPTDAKELQDWINFVELHSKLLLERDAVKANYSCDHYVVDMTTDTASVVSQARYWFGLFTHRRTGLWKGLLQVPLAVSADDAEALELVKP